MKILCIEDHPTQRDIMRQLLELEGFTEVMTAINGQEGLGIALKWQPDVILLDLRMPHIDGFTVLDLLQEDPNIAQIPVIVVSAWTSARNRSEAAKKGAAKFMPKPVDTRRLVEYINELGQRKDSE